MKTLILLLLGLTLPLAKTEDHPDKDNLAHNVASYAEDFRGLLSDDWTVRAKGNEITLTSKFEVFIIGSISRPNAMPAFSDKTTRKELLEETQPEKYTIILRFEERMPEEEYARMRQERQKAANLLTIGTKTKNESTDKLNLFVAHKMPRYRDMYDVYEQLPCFVNGQGRQVYPPKALQKVGGAKEILATVLRQVLTAID